MALPMLVNGADCGPANPLQGLTKQFDRDRGLQQDYIGAGRAGSSAQAFRTPSSSALQLQQQQNRDEAAHFFARAQGQGQAGPSSSSSRTFDMSGLKSAVPDASASASASVNMSAGMNAGIPAAMPVNWAADFLTKPSTASQPAQASASVAHVQQVQQQKDAQIGGVGNAGGSRAMSPMQWTPQQFNYGMSRFSPLPMQQQPQHGELTQNDQIAWDAEFATHEQHLQSQSQSQPQAESSQQQKTPHDADELARTAGLLLDSVRGAQNPKFQESAFMGLMRQLRDREVVIDGNQMVESTGQVSQDASIRGIDKGKGRAVEPAFSFGLPQTRSIGGTSLGMASTAEIISAATGTRHEIPISGEDLYWQKENAEYTEYWEAASRPAPPAAGMDAAWGRMQADWDRLEATEGGIRALPQYRFQARNPYLHGIATRAHMGHAFQQLSSVEHNVLELEAAVQRDPSNAAAWYALGVKQQENEREKDALAALERATALDPAHLATWLALAVSCTNEGNRARTYEAVTEWATRNERYKDVVGGYFKGKGVAGGEGQTGELIRCLMSMARSGGEELDADVQIALAVIFNTNEDYEKAQDCFLAALAVRPDDWLLYNRVGATLANNGGAEEAIQYYRRALELNPGYVRARYNLGISCINLRRYNEAAEHILDALSLQQADSVRDASADNTRGVMSGALWDSLKTTCLHMQRVDLANLCDKRDLDGIRANVF